MSSDEAAQSAKGEAAPQLLKPIYDAIPRALREHTDRWCTWKATRLPKKNKWTKVPCFGAAPFNGISTRQPEHWRSFDECRADATAAQFSLAGVGYLMTGVHGVVGIDLDNCVEGGAVAEWASGILDQVGSYAEFSPSGRGVRIFCLGFFPQDFSSIAEGIEVYAGHSARFLTVTGHHIAGTPGDLTEASEDVLQDLFKRYGTKRVEHTDDPAPDILDELALPDIGRFSLPRRSRDLLDGGEAGEDRSATLNYTARCLFAEGLDRQEVYSILATNRHTLAIALDHRRQDYDRALEYLWVEHCVKPAAKALATAAEFDALIEAAPEPVRQADGPMFEPVDGAAAPAPATKRKRFEPAMLQPFALLPKAHWRVRDVLPKHGLAVLFGQSGAGKSFAALDMLMHVAMGLPWRGRRVERCRVAYVAAEGARGFMARVAAIVEHLKLDWDEVRQWFFVIPDAPNMREKKDALAMAEAILKIGQVRISVFDTLAQVTPGSNENSGEDMGQVLGHLGHISRLTSGLSMAIHHAGKDLDKGARGWSGLKAAADAELMVQSIGAAHLLTVTKSKDGEAGLHYPFGLKRVVLGLDDYGDPVTSCVVEPMNTMPAEPSKHPGSDADRWGARVLQAIERMGHTAGLVKADVVREAAMAAPAPDGKDASGESRKRAARRAFDKLVEDGVLVCEDEDAKEQTWMLVKDE